MEQLDNHWWVVLKLFLFQRLEFPRLNKKTTKCPFLPYSSQDVFLRLENNSELGCRQDMFQKDSGNPSTLWGPPPGKDQNSLWSLMAVRRREGEGHSSVSFLRRGLSLNFLELH